MFKLFKAELKKIFLKPSIFVVTGLIIAMLAVSTFVYKPDTRTDYAKSYGSYQTVNEYYERFTNTDESIGKKKSDERLNLAIQYVNQYINGQNVVDELINDWRAVEALFNTTGSSDYVGLYSNWESATNAAQKASLKNDLATRRQQLLNAIQNFKAKYEELSAKDQPSFLVTKSLDDTIIKEHFFKIQSIFDNASGKTDPDGYIINELTTYKAFALVFSDLDQLLPFIPDDAIINEFKTTKIVDEVEVENSESPVVKAKNRLDELFNTIYEFNESKKLDSESKPQDKAQIVEYFNQYYSISTYIYNTVANGIKVSALSKYTAMDISIYKNFDGANFYELKENYTKYRFLTDNGLYEYNYAEPFSVIQPSNLEINGFDYSYFALRLCTFFITIYVVVLAAGTIAGEQSAGTLKLLAIRPFSRRKLLSAKILATLSIGAILIFVSSLASIVVGLVTYGLNFTNVLVVFNASSAFVINPLILYFIAMLTMFVEVMFYAILSVFISTVFKSNIAAVAISILLFFVSLIINVVAVNVPLLGLIPFVNVNFFKYFGSAFLQNNGAIFQMILTPSVFSGSTFWSSLILYSLTFVVILIITHVIFKKRDIK